MKQRDISLKTDTLKKKLIKKTHFTNIRDEIRDITIGPIDIKKKKR